MSKSPIRRCLKNLRLERNNEALYRHLAQAAPDAATARAYRRIADGEAANASFWEDCLRSHGGQVPAWRPSLRVRVLGKLARHLGVAFILPTAVRTEHADPHPSAVDRSGHEDHFACTVHSPLPARRHAGMGGNTLRASVLGANDGLVSNTSLVMGMAGAASGSHAIVLAGLAGLVAGACSMALGEWLSVNSSREFYQARITERAERIAVAPEEGVRQIADIYRDKGMNMAEAEHLAGHLAQSPRTTLDTMVREELGVDPEELGGSAWRAAVSSFCLFALGALFPVLPYLMFDGTPAFLASMGSAFVGLCLIALGTSLFTGRGLLFSILRQLVITACAAAITYGAGYALGRLFL